MSQNKSDKPAKRKNPWRISGWKLDSLLLIFSLVLGFCLGFLSDHVRNISNYLLSMADHRYWHRSCCLYQLSKHKLESYCQVSWLGITIEVVIIVVILGILYLALRHSRNDVIDEIKKTREDLVDAIDRLGVKIDGLGNRIGGGNAATESQANKGKTGKAEDKKKGGETQHK